MPQEVKKITKFIELSETKKKLQKEIEDIDHRLNNEEIGSTVMNIVKLTLKREDLTKKCEENHKLLIQIANHIHAKSIKEEIPNHRHDHNMLNASDDNISQEDTSEIFNTSSAAVSEQESYQSPMDGYDSDEDYEAPGTSSNTSTVSRRSPAKKPSLLSMLRRSLRRSKRAASKRATEAIRKLFKNILQRTRNLKTESTEDDEDWRQGEFAWIKFTERSKYLPGFVLPAMHGIRKAKTITLKGVLSLYKFVYYTARSRNDDELKDKRYYRALALFNSRNDCKYK